MGTVIELLVAGIVLVLTGLFFIIRPVKVLKLFWFGYITFRLPESEKPQDKQGRKKLIRKYMNTPSGPMSNFNGCAPFLIVAFGLGFLSLGSISLFGYFNP